MARPDGAPQVPSATHGLAVTFGATMHLLYRSFMRDLPGERDPEVVRELIQRFRTLLETDLSNVEQGYYPKSLLFQFPFWRYLLRAPEQLFEFPRVAARRRANGWRDLPREIDLTRFPRYYRRTFHWQTDGWLSQRSAKLYDLEVELLFGGTADIMRRMAIPPIVRASSKGTAPRILDVGCGTGRFLKQLCAALPTMRATGLDMSPFYVKEAARTLADVPEVSLVVDDAESMPFRDEAYDVVSSVFLFHELPRQTRRAVAKEMARVVRAGGTVVVCDSAQRRDSEILMPALEGFARTYHEPFYLDYVEDPLEDLLEQAGLRVVESAPHSVSKVVVAVRPDFEGGDRAFA
ncbi:MAG: class I SAM-dependent methyltransferase [Myxococcales bacterium]|nr:class I SAM-dependent methyltransferase [Myxococcales bacterium]